MSKRTSSPSAEVQAFDEFVSEGRRMNAALPDDPAARAKRTARNRAEADDEALLSGLIARRRELAALTDHFQERGLLFMLATRRPSPAALFQIRQELLRLGELDAFLDALARHRSPAARLIRSALTRERQYEIDAWLRRIEITDPGWQQRDDVLVWWRDEFRPLLTVAGWGKNRPRELVDRVAVAAGEAFLTADQAPERFSLPTFLAELVLDAIDRLPPAVDVPAKTQRTRGPQTGTLDIVNELRRLHYQQGLSWKQAGAKMNMTGQAARKLVDRWKDRV